MLFDYGERARGQELMDDFSVTDGRLTRGLSELRKLNRLLNGYGPVKRSLVPLLQGASDPLRVLDIGCGIGDLAVEIVHWSQHLGVEVSVTATDANPATVEVAANYTSSFSQISVAQCDAFALPFGENAFDVVVASQFLHHFVAADAVRVLREAARVARSKVIVSDLHRNALARLGVSALTRVMGFGEMVRYDAPISVRRGFVRGELATLAGQAGMAANEYWVPLFRWGLCADVN